MVIVTKPVCFLTNPCSWTLEIATPGGCNNVAMGQFERTQTQTSKKAALLYYDGAKEDDDVAVKFLHHLDKNLLKERGWSTKKKIVTRGIIN